MSGQSAQQLCLPWMSFAEGSRAPTCPLPLEVWPAVDWTGSGLGSGTKCYESSPSYDLKPSSPKTSLGHGATGCPTCGATYTESGMPACRFDCEPLTLAHPMSAPASSWFPTPTATQNATAPSMQKHPGSRRISALVGIGRPVPPPLWEWMMGVPNGWTATEL